MSGAGERGGKLPRLVLLALCSLATLAAVHGLARALANRVALTLVLGPPAWLVLGLALAALACTTGALLVAQSERRDGTLPELPGALGALLVVAVAAWGLALGFVQPMQRLWFDLGLGLTAGAWCGTLLALARRRAALPRALRLGARLLVVLCALVVLGELGLRALAALRPMPILARTSDAPRRTIERFRCAPGELRFGTACNARGFFDEPFARRSEGQGLVCVIGDSFGVGVVPLARHYTTVAERALDVPVANIGVAGIGPPEYLNLLVEEALPLDPDTVVIALFVGNDLEFASDDGPGRGLRQVFERERVLLCVLPGRLARLRRERADAGAPPGPSPARLDQVDPAGLDDPLLEQASLSAQAFERLERARALAACGGDPASLPELQRLLLRARELVGSRTFVVLLIPDEFQVEDELWGDVRAAAGRELERRRPQRVLSAWLAGQGIACLDLLPVLRAVEPLDDGRRHVYHLRDTHFNSRGNRVAGEALAAFLAGLRGD